MNIQFVERPDVFHKTKAISEQVRALIETATNKKAVAIPLNGKRCDSMQSNLRGYLRKHGYRFHYRLDPNNKTIIAWTEKKK